MALTDYTSGGGLFGDALSNDVGTSYSTTGINYGSGGFMNSAGGIFDSVTSAIDGGLQSWINFEKAKGLAESYGVSQEQQRTSAQTPSGYVNTPNVGAVGSLPGGITGRQLLIGGGVVLLAYYLMK